MEVKIKKDHMLHFNVPSSAGKITLAWELQINAAGY